MKVLTPFLSLFLITISAFAADKTQQKLVQLTSKDTGGTYNLTLLWNPSNPSDLLHLFIDSEASSHALIDLWSNQDFQTQNPPTLAVLAIGTDNFQQHKDLTADALRDVPGSGHAAVFHSYIQNEILPYISEITHTAFQSTTLHTKGHAAAFGFFALFRKNPLFQFFLFESPSMEWHNAYPFRAEYAYYKSMAVSFPAPVVILPLYPETTQKTFIHLNEMSQLLKYRAYENLDCVFATPAHGSPKERLDALQPYLLKK